MAVLGTLAVVIVALVATLVLIDRGRRGRRSFDGEPAHRTLNDTVRARNADGAYNGCVSVAGAFTAAGGDGGGN
jgi:hypothetical protein